MKYYLDTEFLEGSQNKTFLGFKYGETKPTIDLISIGIVCEDSREYYAISKDFNLKEAWNRYDLKTEQVSGDMRNIFPEGITYKDYWIRDNVLKPIFADLYWDDLLNYRLWSCHRHSLDYEETVNKRFTYSKMKELIQKYGKSNKQIAEEICDFIDARISGNSTIMPVGTSVKEVMTTNVKFYGYNADYDWVVFCWLFGKMIDLPKGFSMYCTDLKQTLDTSFECSNKLEMWGKDIKKHPEYPKQTNEHHALYDAKWIKKLHEFLNKL